MQTIVHEAGYHYISPLLHEIDTFYRDTSEKSIKSTGKGLLWGRYHRSFFPLWEIFKDHGYDYELSFYGERNLPKIDISGIDKKNIIVCFSGGKDSVAAALHYKKLGYNVFLFHVKHINSQYDEYIACEELADYLDMPLYIEDIKLSGRNDWIEHPMKNMIIANCALNYGIRTEIAYKIAFGNYYTSMLSDNDFESTAGDCRDMWDAYEHIIQTIIPKFKIYMCLPNAGTTLNRVCTDPKLLNKTISCIGRTGLRQYRHDWILNKFGVELPAKRCGSCYKCAIEYIYRADKGLTPFNEKYYTYCLQVCYNQLVKWGDYAIDIDDLWSKFLFYKKSAHCKDIVLENGKVFSTNNT